MGSIWHDISEERIFPTDFISVIEISKGSKKKSQLNNSSAPGSSGATETTAIRSMCS